jgi:hypothetical protein
VASVPLMLEYESVLTRSEHLTAARISMADAEVLLDAIALVASRFGSRTCGGRCCQTPATISCSKRL